VLPIAAVRLSVKELELKPEATADAKVAGDAEVVAARETTISKDTAQVYVTSRRCTFEDFPCEGTSLEEVSCEARSDEGERRRRTVVEVTAKFRMSESLTPDEEAMAAMSEVVSASSGVSLAMVKLKQTDTATVSAVVGS
jgi:hypothetical protein